MAPAVSKWTDFLPFLAHGTSRTSIILYSPPSSQISQPNFNSGRDFHDRKSLGMPHVIMNEQDPYTRVLENALELCNYDDSIRTEVIDWFQDSMLPFIRSKPKTKWTPRLTHHNTAFEPSINTRGDGLDDKTVRFTIEAIGPQASTEKDRWNQDIQLELLESIKEKVENLDLKLFNHFSKALFITPKDEWRKFQPEPEASPSCFLAFDIDRSKGVAGIGPKAYLFPKLKSLQTGISPGSIIEETITQLHNDDDFDVLPALEMIMEYLQEPGSNLTLNDVEMIGFDCIALDKDPHIKIYAHSWRNTFDAAENTYTLGGLLPNRETDLDALEEFWKLLFNDEHETANWKSMPLKPLTADPRSTFVYSFEITPGDPEPSVKVYFPMWCFAPSDADLRRRLDCFFALKGWEGLVGNYEQNLEMIL